LSLAARTAPGGRVVAVDRHAKRLLRVLDNVRRTGVEGVRVVAADMTKPAPFARPFDDVLVDAPCSGTGTLRRHPEIRWRLRPEDLPDLATRQRRLLDVAATLVRPGGRLVYSVCSLEPEEGDDVVASFLAEHAEFVRADPRPALSASARKRVGADLALRTTPADSEMDGFYAALLKKREN
jgi:16S rRNA (cytosine967-C5)-methyltransferase